MAKVHDTLGAADGAREIIFENAVYDIKTTPSPFCMVTADTVLLSVPADTVMLYLLPSSSPLIL